MKQFPTITWDIYLVLWVDCVDLLFDHFLLKEWVDEEMWEHLKSLSELLTGYREVVVGFGGLSVGVSLPTTGGDQLFEVSVLGELLTSLE